MAQENQRKELEFNFLPNVTAYQFSLGGPMYDCSLNDLVFGALLKYNFSQKDFSGSYKLVMSSLVNKELFASKFANYHATLGDSYLDLKTFFEQYDAFFAKCMALDTSEQSSRLSEVIDTIFFNKFHQKMVSKAVYSGFRGASHIAKFSSVENFVSAFYSRIRMWEDVLYSKSGWRGATWESLLTLRQIFSEYVDTFPKTISEKVTMNYKKKVEEGEEQGEEEYTTVEEVHETEQLVKTIQMVQRLANDFRKRDKEARDKEYAAKKEEREKRASEPQRPRQEHKNRNQKKRV